MSIIPQLKTSIQKELKSGLELVKTSSVEMIKSEEPEKESEEKQTEPLRLLDAVTSVDMRITVAQERGERKGQVIH